jgi:hypothetical protein
MESRLFMSSSVPVGPEFRINDFTEGAQFAARGTRHTVASDFDGNSVVVWQSYGQDGDGYGIYAKRFDANGVAQQASGAAPGVTEFRVNVETRGWQVMPSVAMNAAGDFVVAWQGNDANGYGDIYARRFNSAGQPQGGEIPVNRYFTDGEQALPSVAMNANCVAEPEPRGPQRLPRLRPAIRCFGG